MLVSRPQRAERDAAHAVDSRSAESTAPVHGRPGSPYRAARVSPFCFAGAKAQAQHDPERDRGSPGSTVLRSHRGTTEDARMRRILAPRRRRLRVPDPADWTSSSVCIMDLTSAAPPMRWLIPGRLAQKDDRQLMSATGGPSTDFAHQPKAISEVHATHVRAAAG